MGVRGHWNFPNCCIGTIAEPPEFAVQLVENCGPWDGVRRFVQGRKGTIEFYWVEFETPQNDGDGDGPYAAGEVEVEYITLKE
ncbi:MAG: hypothetical protein GY714_05435 [Desulfobacterales bacterium]|nr:hypothetical protein [Desulfobacterales bacterium]